MNPRAKGQRTLRKALAYLSRVYPKASVIVQYQASRFSTPQPFDLLVLPPHAVPILVEVRSNQWGIGKAQTKRLAALPGIVRKQVWRFRDGETTPDIRTWDDMTQWWVGLGEGYGR